MLSTRRASYTHVNPNLRIGKTARPFLQNQDHCDVHNARLALDKALKATDSKACDFALSEAFRLLRRVAARRS